MPSLVRSENGGAQQVVARGIEDLQVQYVRADAGWPATTGTVSDVPPPINVTSTAADFYQSLVTEVRVTISARTAAQRIQGATAPGGVANLALRGSLASQASPRQALWVLAQDTTTARWN
jgi:hypothetical protein